MRTVTAGEQTLLQGAHYATHLRVKVADADGTMQDISDRCVSGNITQTVDQVVTQGTLRFQMVDSAGQSLSPLDQTSTLNRDAGASYAPLVDVGRDLTVEVATVANGSSPGASDWQLLLNGTVDEWDLAGDGETMSVMARDALGAELADRWVEYELELGSDEGTAIETVMQEILDEFSSGISLYTPTSPGFLIKPYRQQKESLLQALRTLASLIGWVIEPRWDDGTGAFRLTFYEPDRSASTTTWTFGPSDYYEVPRFALSRLNVRNVVDVTYTDASTGARETLTSSDADSIARFGRQWMEIEEGEDSPIDTSAEATDLLTAALSDLKDPVAEGAKRTLAFWPVQLGDYYQFSGNAVHYSADTDFGISGFTHQWDASGQVDTVLQIRGKPVGYTDPWLFRGATPRPPDEQRAGLDLYDVHVEYGTPSTGKATVSWKRGSDVYEVAYYLKTLTQPVSRSDTPWPRDGAAPTDALSIGTDELVVDVPDAGDITFLQLEGRAEDLEPGRPKRVEIHPQAVSSGADLPAGSVLAEALIASAQTWDFDGSWTATSATAVQWGAGTLTFNGGTSYSINTNSATGLSGPSTPTFIYFDATVSTTEFQDTTDWGATVSDTAVLIAIAWSGGTLANVVPGTSSVQFDGGVLHAASVVSAKLTVVSLSSISADLGTVTAGTVSTNVLIAADTFSASRATFTGELEVQSNVIFSGGFAIQLEDGEILEFYDTGNTFRGDIRGSTSSPAGLLFRGDMLLGESSDKVAVMGGTPSTPPTYSPSNVTTDRTFDANSTTLAELADVVGTVIADLQTFGAFQ